jgi:hypothetical protein
MKHQTLMLLVCLSLAALLFQNASAQTSTPFAIGVSKDFGYNDFRGRIQGTFTVKAQGPEDLVKVVFFLDGEVLAEDTAAPFRYQFSTDNYPIGVHSFTATGYTSDGQELVSNEIRKEFISGSEGCKATLGIAVPILGLVFGAMLIVAIFSITVGKRKLDKLPLGAPRNDGALGGTVCPKCGRPFGVHIWGLNVLVGKLDRCPYCGKWSLIVRQSPQALRQAELAELAELEGAAGEFQAPSEEERLRKDLDNSRYQDN